MIEYSSRARLVEELLSTPFGSGKKYAPRQSPELVRNTQATTALSIEQIGSNVVVEVEAGTPESEAAEYASQRLGGDEAAAAGLVLVGMARSAWGDPDNPRESVRYEYSLPKRGAHVGPMLEDEQIVGLIRDASEREVAPLLPDGPWGAAVLIGDMQFGKADGDGVEGTVFRTVRCLDMARAVIELFAPVLGGIGHVHLAWLGDHVEGFVSQGGANAWRTRLTLSEQIRLTRRAMQYGLEVMAPLAPRMSMVAVPGNHGETIRFAGKGVTRYDDSHDTESLIAVMDFAHSHPDLFGHVEFFVPDNDELTVVTNVAGTYIAHNHGHPWRPGKHFDWWAKQAFNRDSPMSIADVLAAGHLHHEHVEADGDRLYIGVPALESESTWYRHNSGSGGAPGVIVIFTKDGHTPIKITVNENGLVRVNDSR